MDISQLIANNISPAFKVIETFYDNPRNGIAKTVVTFEKLFLEDDLEVVVSIYTVEQYNIIDFQDILINKFSVEKRADKGTLVDYTGVLITDLETPHVSEWEYFKYLETQNVHIPSLKSAYITRIYNNGGFDKPKGI